MDLPLADFVFYVVLGAFIVVPILASGSRLLHNQVEKRSARNRVICRLCQHAFEDANPGKMVTCPACGARNEKGRGRRLG